MEQELPDITHIPETVEEIVSNQLDNPELILITKELLSKLLEFNSIFGRTITTEETLGELLQDDIDRYEEHGKDGLTDILYCRIIRYIDDYMLKFNVDIDTSDVPNIKDFDKELGIFLDFIKNNITNNSEEWDMESFEMYCIQNEDYVVKYILKFDLPVDDINYDYAEQEENKQEDDREIRDRIIYYATSNFTIDTYQSQVWSQFVLGEPVDGFVIEFPEERMDPIKEFDSFITTLYKVEMQNIPNEDLDRYPVKLKEMILKFRGVL